MPTTPSAEIVAQSNSFSNLPNDQLVLAVECLSANPKTPPAYRDVLQKITSVVRKLIKEREAEAIKSSEYVRKINSIYEQYRVLEDLYKEEHKQVLDQQDQLAINQLKLQEKDKAREEAEKNVSQLNAKIEAITEEHKKSAQRQGLGRKNIEDKLMARDIELTELKRKYQELETHLSKATLEADRYKKENSQLKLVLTYIHNPQEYQQQIQQQMQQQLHQPQQPQ
ncbi:uncharacterized protein B0P05DRAFT_576169 [Gilbertella persicaria]|uniref:uncharacterized protein n=1 Tax=Gilbertella persicaria TaxID=101096 RepID=UPI00221E6A52|nr:uncharacterized protein B0P05DRAFT_576169 [Gilbertella persicaria]KAI8047818.1 hypothetical protein B0P05DRAFT_576169 [Gilbertella persicaria]